MPEPSASPETVGELIAVLEQYDRSDFVVLRQVFATETVRILAVDKPANSPRSVIITYDE